MAQKQFFISERGIFTVMHKNEMFSWFKSVTYGIKVMPRSGFMVLLYLIFLVYLYPFLFIGNPLPYTVVILILFLGPTATTFYEAGRY